MGILCWTGTMIGYVRSLLIIICLHLPILWTKMKIPDSGDDITYLDNPTRAPWAPGDDISYLANPTRAPWAPVLSDVEVLQILTEEVGSTFKVRCVPDKIVLEDGMSGFGMSRAVES